MTLQEELKHNVERIQEVSEAFKLAEGKERKVMELLLGSLYETQNMIFQKLNQM
jgi:hypothetical protein